MKPRFYSTARTAPDETNGLKVPYAPAKRQPPKWGWYLILLVVSSPLIYFGVTATYSLIAVTAPGNVILKQYELRSTRSGYVKRILSQLGDEVQPGQQLVELADPVLDKKQLRIKGDLASLGDRNDVRALTLEGRLREQVALAQRLLRHREQSARTFQGLFQQGAATFAEVQVAQAQVIEATANLSHAHADLVAEQRQKLPKEDPQFLGEKARIDTEMEVLDQERGQLPQVANYAGRVIDIYVNEGEFVGAGAQLMLIGMLEAPMIVAYLEPKHTRAIERGSAATIRFPDGTRVAARVAGQPVLTQRLPADLVNTFGIRPMSVMLKLAPETVWPREDRIHGLPVDVRFHYAWESTLANWMEPP